MVVVLPPKSVALIGAVCLTIGWLLASVLTPPIARVQTLQERRPAAADAATRPAPFTELLQMQLRHAPEPPTPRRNPFVFGARPRIAPSAPSQTEPHAAIPAVPDVARPVGPIYELSGIGISGDARTAVLTDGNSVTVAKVGDSVGGYRVVEISDTSVTLAAVSGERHILSLR